MESLINKIYREIKNTSINGDVAKYIPELAKVDPGLFGVSVIDINGNEYNVGHSNFKFTIQSISKIVGLLLALEDRGCEEVFKKVGKEPTGDPFNSIIKLETFDENKPFNPMINAGAISIDSLIYGESCDEKFKRFTEYFGKLTSNPNISYNEEVYKSEFETGNRNKAMAYFLKDIGNIESNVEETVRFYFKQCAVEATASDIAKIGSLLANDGIDRVNKKRIIPHKHCNIVKSYMATCGMYDGSGAFAISVGVPAKSGVGGGIMCTVKNRMGIGLFGPALDKRGNSVRGIEFMEKLSEELNLNIY